MTVEVVTGRPELILRSFTTNDAAALSALMRANERHLTRHGDYVEIVRMSPAEHARAIAGGDSRLGFGVYRNGVLVGAVMLIAVDPPRYGLGFWLAESACGRGIATVAVRAVIQHAVEALGAKDIFAGVTHGNAASVAVLHRAGFRRVAGFDTYDRYRRTLA